MPDIRDTVNDYNQNIGGTTDPRLEGYLPVDYFRIVDTDRTSRRIREAAIPVEQFYDYNLENPSENCDDNIEE